LGLERIGINDNFFELGGHSLLATQVVSRMKLEGLEIPLRIIFESPTIESIATFIFGKNTYPIDQLLTSNYLEINEKAKYETGGTLTDLVILNIDQLKSKMKIKTKKNVTNIPLSFAQKRLWFLDQFEPGS